MQQGDGMAVSAQRVSGKEVTKAWTKEWWGNTLDCQK